MQQDLFHQPARGTRKGNSTVSAPPASRVPIYTVTLVREASMTHPQPQLRSSQDAADLLRRFLGPVDREYFVVVLLDRRNRLIGINTVSIGSLTASVVHPREVLCAVRGFVSYRYSK
jgi:DNA repair protein RadC